MTRFHFPASLQAPHGRELWLVGARPRAEDAAGLGRSLATRGLTRVLVEIGGPGPERMEVAERAAEGSGAQLVTAAPEDLGAALATAGSEAGRGAGLALVAGEAFVLELLEWALRVPPRKPASLGLVSGRATCLRMAAIGWLLAHHNVRDPGSVRQGPEGLGRPS